MTKPRPKIPRALAEKVLREYSHKCAFCGRHEPHLHHIDENPANNTEVNLLPLCPNCHLQDLHNPTEPPDPEKLILFRKFKDPLILDSRYHPLFARSRFLYNCVNNESKPSKFYTGELLDFVEELKMGGFYKKKIQGHIEYCENYYVLKCLEEGGQLTREEVFSNPELIKKAKEWMIYRIESLLIELLRYQDWTPRSRI